MAGIFSPIVSSMNSYKDVSALCFSLQKKRVPSKHKYMFSTHQRQYIIVFWIYDSNKNSQSPSVINSILIFKCQFDIQNVKDSTTFKWEIILLDAHSMPGFAPGDTKIINICFLPCCNFTFILLIHYILKIHIALKIFIKYGMYIPPYSSIRKIK